MQSEINGIRTNVMNNLCGGSVINVSTWVGLHKWENDCFIYSQPRNLGPQDAIIILWS